MLPLLCPELQEPQKLEETLLSLIDSTCSARENLGFNFPRDMLQDVVQKPVADKCFKCMRSCLLLGFCWAMMEVYRSYAEEEAKTGEKGELVEGDAENDLPETETEQ